MEEKLRKEKHQKSCLIKDSFSQALLIASHMGNESNINKTLK
jgi:hypothetical protein